jgi:hypothetical protein
MDCKVFKQKEGTNLTSLRTLSFRGWIPVTWNPFSVFHLENASPKDFPLIPVTLWMVTCLTRFECIQSFSQALYYALYGP